MKRLSTFLLALLLTWIGARAERTDFTSSLNNNWTRDAGNTSTGKYGDNAYERYGSEITGSATTPTKVLYETVTGLSNGIYTVQFYAVANNAWVGAATGKGIAQAFANDVTQDMVVYDQTECSVEENWHLYTLTTAVTNGTLQYGLQNIATGGNWYVAEGVSLYKEELDTYIGAASSDKTGVTAGQTVTVTFDVQNGTTGDNAVTLTTDDTVLSNVTLNGSSCTLTGGSNGSFTLTIPSDGTADIYTLSIPAGLLSYGSGQASSAAQTLNFYKTAVTESKSGVYLMNAHLSEMLSRGCDWGTEADCDFYGIPVDIEVDASTGLASIKYLDSQLYLYGDSWAWTDGGDLVDNNRPQSTFAIISYSDATSGVTSYQFISGDADGTPLYLYVNETDQNYEEYKVAVNGHSGTINDDGQNYTYETQLVWQILSMEERDAQKAARELNDHIAIAAADGVTVTTEDEFEAFIAALGKDESYTSYITDNEFKSVASTNVSGWLTKVNPTCDTNGGMELWNNYATFSQKIENLPVGVYELTLHGFYRQGQNIIVWPLKEYDLSIAYIEANGYETNIISWAKEATATDVSVATGFSPNNVNEAYTACNSGYEATLYTYVTADTQGGTTGTLDISIVIPGYDFDEWTYLRSIALTYYGEDKYTNDVTWELANPSFEVDNVVENLEVDTSADSGTARHNNDNEGAWKVETLTGWDLSSSEVDAVDLMTAKANATDNNLGVPSAAADGTYWLYLKKTWGDNAGSASVKQKVTLPAGEYKLTVQSMAIAGSATAKLFAGEEASKSITINGTSAGSNDSHPIAELTDWTTNELAFTVEYDDTEVELGVEFTFPTGASVGSFLIDNFKLYSVEAITESISWTMTDAGWGTLILPFDATLPNGLTAYTCDGTEESTDEDGNPITVVKPTEAEGAITANTPYIIGGTASTYTFEGVPTPAEDGTYKEIYSEGLLTGTLVDLAVAKGAAFTLDGTEYLLQHHEGEDDSAAFYPIIVTDGENDSSEATLNKYHCYLTLDSSTDPSGVRAFISLPGSDGEATAIKAIETVEGTEATDGAIYDLSGRRVAKAVKGVYIQNGKKVLVK